MYQLVFNFWVLIGTSLEEPCAKQLVCNATDKGLEKSNQHSASLHEDASE